MPVSKPDVALLSFAVPAIFLVILSGCISLGDTKGFVSLRDSLYSQGPTPRETPGSPERFFAEARILGNGTVLYFQERVSLSPEAISFYNMKLSESLYTCSGVYSTEFSICPEEFSSIEETQREFFNVAMKRKPAEEPYHDHVPFISIDGRGGELEAFSFSSVPKTAEIMEAAKDPQGKLATYNSSERRSEASIKFKEPFSNTLCIYLGVIPKRTTLYRISAEGRAPSSWNLSREISETGFDIEGETLAFSSNQTYANEGFSVLSACFSKKSS